MSAMLCFDEGDHRFQLRAVGIAVREGHLLVHRATVEDFWSLPGGRIERGECAEETLQREMVEEIQQSVEIGPLMCIIENFFVIAPRTCHEVGLYHRMEVPANFPFTTDGTVCHRIRDGESDLEFKWVRIARDTLDAVRLKPSPLIDHLLSGTTVLTHIVEHDPEPLPLASG